MRSVLFDTNVLLDYFLARGESGETSKRLIGTLWDGDYRMLVTSGTLKDLFYLVAAAIKRGARNKAGVLTEEDAKTASFIAWSCVRQATELMTVTETGWGECLRAITLRNFHDDFEDNLLIASAERAHIDYVVTRDRQLIERAPLACLSPEDMLRLVEAEEEPVAIAP